MKVLSSVGYSDFTTFRERGYYFVDKSALISEVVAATDAVLLLTRPRRFGKTMNLTMLRDFFDQRKNSSALFEGLIVAKDAVAMTHLNNWPTVFLTFKDMVFQDWEDCVRGLRTLAGKLVEEHWPEIAPVATGMALTRLAQLRNESADLLTCRDALRLVTELLHKAHGRKVMVLLDEYDTPFHDSHDKGFFAEMVQFMRVFLGGALKDNPHLERCVITGIMRVSKETIFSGLNNLTSCSVLNRRFSSHFGFTETELRRLLDDFGLSHLEAAVQEWYNGYRIGDCALFNPWSICTFVQNHEDGLKSYWIGSSGNELVRERLQLGKGIDPLELDTLLRGQSLRRVIQESVALVDLNHESIWSLLLYSGYLTFNNYDPQTGACDLCLPNREVRSFFEQSLRSWLGEERRARRLIEDLLALRLECFTKNLAEVIGNALSFLDVGREKEAVYHVFMVGLMANLPGYAVFSNRESGHGRYDLALIPRSPRKPGFVFEFKLASGVLVDAAAAALDQIERRDYPASLRAHGVDPIVLIGMSFFGKKVAIATRTFERDKGLSEVSTFQGTVPS